jgi:hypothetical protein
VRLLWRRSPVGEGPRNEVTNMTLSKRWIALPGLWFTLAIAAPVPAQAVTSDDTILKQIIIFGRHSVRSPIISPASYAQYSPRPYPDFGVPPGYLTIHGQQAEVLLGAYYRSYLLSEGLLTGDTRRPVPAPAATAVPRRDRRHAEGDARRGGRGHGPVAGARLVGGVPLCERVVIQVPPF